MEVTFPDGTRVRASSIFERDADDPDRDFGLYLDPRWEPSWAAEVVEWEDHGVPADGSEAARRIRDAFARARDGETVEIGCLGGIGRTGTVLSCMAVLAGVDPAHAVAWVRRNYRPGAVETRDQERWVAWFAEQGAPGDVSAST
jgi:hypothetical protein